MPKLSVHTLGCKLNFAETSAIARQFVERGYDLVDMGQEADVCLINTCTVTERADRECRQIIRRARRKSKDPYVIVTGCYAQLAPEKIASIPGVDLVLGAKEKFSLFEHAGVIERSGAPRVYVSEIAGADDFGPGFSTAESDRTRAFLKVQDGCDYSCSFCTIPLARGSSRSQPVDACLVQARSLVTQGFREIVLTGVNTGDFGHTSGTTLLELLRGMVCIDGLDRIRVSSIEPNLVTDDLIAFIASEEKMCRHLHIPLQSGSDEILRSMRRRYLSGDYASLVSRIRARVPGCGIGVDVITGFPGESEGHFEETYRFVADLDISYLHVFTYSERPNTPAASMPSKIPPAERSRRTAMLRILSQKKRSAFLRGLIGKTEPVLLEGDIDGGGRSGYTSAYARVVVPTDHAEANTIVPVEIIAEEGERLIGRLSGRGV